MRSYNDVNKYPFARGFKLEFFCILLIGFFSFSTNLYASDEDDKCKASLVSNVVPFKPRANHTQLNDNQNKTKKHDLANTVVAFNSKTLIQAEAENKISPAPDKQDDLNTLTDTVKPKKSLKAKILSLFSDNKNELEKNKNKKSFAQKKAEAQQVNTVFAEAVKNIDSQKVQTIVREHITKRMAKLKSLDLDVESFEQASLVYLNIIGIHELRFVFFNEIKTNEEILKKNLNIDMDNLDTEQAKKLSSAYPALYFMHRFVFLQAGMIERGRWVQRQLSPNYIPWFRKVLLHTLSDQESTDFNNKLLALYKNNTTYEVNEASVILLNLQMKANLIPHFNKWKLWYLKAIENSESLNEANNMMLAVLKSTSLKDADPTYIELQNTALSYVEPSLVQEAYSLKNKIIIFILNLRADEYQKVLRLSEAVVNSKYKQPKKLSIHLWLNTELSKQQTKEVLTLIQKIEVDRRAEAYSDI